MTLMKKTITVVTIKIYQRVSNSNHLIRNGK